MCGINHGLYLQQGPAAGCLIMGRCLCLWGPGGLARVCVGSSSGQEAWEESHCCLPPTAPPRLLLGVWRVAVWVWTVAPTAKLLLSVFPQMIHPVAQGTRPLFLVSKDFTTF